MKELFKTIIAFTLLTISVSIFITSAAFAADGDNVMESRDVKGTFKSSDAAAVFAVTISWDDLNYNYEVNKKWDYEKGIYEYVGGEWKAANENSGLIKVTNHSNTDVNVTMKFTPADEFGEISGTFVEASSFSLKDAATTNAGQDDDPSTSTRLTISGGSLSEGNTDVTVGSVTVTVSKADSSSSSTESTQTKTMTLTIDTEYVTLSGDGTNFSGTFTPSSDMTRVGINAEYNGKTYTAYTGGGMIFLLNTSKDTTYSGNFTTKKKYTINVTGFSEAGGGTVTITEQ